MLTQTEPKSHRMEETWKLLQKLLTSETRIEGVAYLSALDFAVLRKYGFKKFEPCTQKDKLLAGYFGELHQAPPDETEASYYRPIYVSRLIPEGFVYIPPERDVLLNWVPPIGERALRPEVTLNRAYLHSIDQ